MSDYAKLFNSILASTLWAESSDVRVVWITMLAMKDRDGIVEASIPGLAKMASVDRGAVEQAIALFLAPDADSRSKEHEGRRIVEVDGGWRVLNHEKYQHKSSAEDYREKAAERQRRKRERDAARVAQSRPVSRDVTPVTPPSRHVTENATSALLCSDTTTAEAVGASAHVRPPAPTRELKAPNEAQGPAPEIQSRADINRAPVQNPREKKPACAPAREPDPEPWLAWSQAYGVAYEAAGRPIWQHGADRPHFAALAAWGAAQAAQDGVTEADVVARTLANFFADPWVQERDYPPAALAKKPGRYYRPPSSSGPPPSAGSEALREKARLAREREAQQRSEREARAAGEQQRQ